MTTTSTALTTNLLFPVSSRLSLHDFECLAELAQSHGMSVAQFVRHLILKEIAR